MISVFVNETSNFCLLTDAKKILVFLKIIFQCIKSMYVLFTVNFILKDGNKDHISLGPNFSVAVYWCFLRHLKIKNDKSFVLMNEGSLGFLCDYKNHNHIQEVIIGEWVSKQIRNNILSTNMQICTLVVYCDKCKLWFFLISQENNKP